MLDLKIRLFGPLEIYSGESRLSGFPTQKSKNLFAYLALHHDRLWEREALASLFWQDSPAPSARKCLRTELWRIRSVLSQAGRAADGLLMIDKGRVGLCKSPNIYIDADEFENCARRFESRPGEKMEPGEGQVLASIIELYRGEFLEGSYENWAVSARERFKGLFIGALVKLLEYHRSRGEWSAAIAYAKEALSHDPFLENVHRDLMACMWHVGRRAAALHQYSQFAELLKRELGVEPMLETIELYQRIKATASPRPTAPRGKVSSYEQASSDVEVERLLIQLTALQTHLGEVDKALREIVERVKQISPQYAD